MNIATDRVEDDTFSICDFTAPNLRVIDALLRFSPDIVIVLNYQGAIVYVGLMAAKVLERTPEEMLGKTATQLGLPPELSELFDQQREAIFAHATPGTSAMVITTPSGRRNYEWTFSAVGDSEHTTCAMLCIGRDVTDQLQSLSDRTLLAAIVDSCDDAIIGKDLDGTIVTWNNAAETIFGYTAGEIIGKPKTVLFPEDRLGEEIDILQRVRAGEHTSHFETIRRRKDGTLLNVSITISPIRDSAGNITGASTIIRDMTDRKRLEAQLYQAQKIESVGRLAGGIAHDFNNYLSAIMGYAELAELDADPGGQISSNLQVVQMAASRAATLTRQLLAFARRQPLEPHVFSMNELIVETDKLLRRVIGEDIELVSLPGAGLESVKADPNQIAQVLLNLAINARDAMPDGGTLTIETQNVDLDEEYTQSHAEVQPGRYVVIAVTDTGSGLTDEVKAHLFEPFFTTKEVGKGTGLGLATCHGIVKQSGGHIWVYSELNHGTSFKVYLPVVNEPPTEIRRDPASNSVPVGTETVLIAEDEPLLRSLSAKILEAQGYRVLVASNGVDALRLAADVRGEIHLLVTDVVMPQMGGRALAEALIALRPNLRILYVSGYTENAIVHRGTLDAGTAFLQKPYMPGALARKVREVLDGQDRTH